MRYGGKNTNWQANKHLNMYKKLWTVHNLNHIKNEKYFILAQTINLEWRSLIHRGDLLILYNNLYKRLQRWTEKRTSSLSISISFLTIGCCSLHTYCWYISVSSFGYRALTFIFLFIFSVIFSLFILTHGRCFRLCLFHAPWAVCISFDAALVVAAPKTGAMPLYWLTWL